jgi:hypothetical protein
MTTKLTISLLTLALLARAAAGADGTIDARVVGQRVSRLSIAGMHGTDVRYTATVATRRRWRVGTKYTARISLAGEAPVVRLVKLQD